MKFPVTYEIISTTGIQTVQRPLVRLEEFDRAVAAGKRRMHKLGMVVVQMWQGGFHLVGNEFALRLAQSEGIKNVNCMVLQEGEVYPPEFSQLLDVYYCKLTPPVEKAELIAIIVASGFLGCPEIANVLGAANSMIYQLHSVSKLPLDVKKDIRRSGERVMRSVTRFLGKRLKLRVNGAKSAVDRPWRRTFLGYTMSWHQKPKLPRKFTSGFSSPVSGPEPSSAFGPAGTY